MTPKERAIAALNNEEADRLSAYPIACGVCRKLIGDGTMTYSDWVSDPVKFAQAFIAGQQKFGFDFCIGLMDLSVMAGDMGAHVRMDNQNTPFIDQHIEDYETLQVPDIKKGRTNVLIEGTKLFCDKLNDEVVTSSFIEGPLLAVSQSVGAEKMFMDMFTDPDIVHKAVKVTTEYDLEIIKGFAETGVQAICYDYLWANYAVLGDKEYADFEGDVAAPIINKATNDNGMAVAIHNCSDLPHLDMQISKFKPALYSMAYYPLIDGSPDAVEVIEKGYADNCLIAGQLDPQLFMRATYEKTYDATRDLCQNVKTALCKRGLNGRYCISSGCEVPPDETCKLENITAVMDAVKEHGKL